MPIKLVSEPRSGCRDASAVEIAPLRHRPLQEIREDVRPVQKHELSSVRRATHEKQSAVADGNVEQPALGGDGGNQGGADILQRAQLVGEIQNRLIALEHAALQRFRNRFVRALAGIRLAKHPHRGLAGELAVLHASHPVAEDGEKSGVQRSLAAKTERIFLGLARSNMLRASRTKSHSL